MAKKGSSFADRVKERAKQAEFSGGTDALKMKDGISFYKPKKGKNEFIVVPFEMDLKKNAEDIAQGDLWFRLQIWKHFRIGPDDKSVICPKTIGKKCPICEHRAALIAQGRATDDPEVKELTARKRELYYILDLEDDDKLKIMEFSYHNFGRKLEEEIREADDDSLVANFADPENGAILTVRMAEESLGKNKYLEATRFDFEERGKAENKLVAAAMEEVTPFGQLLIVKSYDELRNLLYDIGPDENEETDPDDEEASAPIRKKSKETPQRKKQAEAESDEDDDDSDMDDEEDEEPAPKRHKSADDEEPPVRRKKVADEEDKASKHKSSKRQDDDEEDEEPIKRKKPAKRQEDDDDDAPAPKSNKKSSKSDDPECSGPGTFGEDCDRLDECEDCPNWADCRDLTDEFEAAKKKGSKK